MLLSSGPALGREKTAVYGGTGLETADGTDLVEGKTGSDESFKVEGGFSGCSALSRKASWGR